MNKRPRKRVIIKSETPIPPPRKWKDVEMEILFDCLIKFGHKDLDKICDYLPGRSVDNIKNFIRTVHDTAGKMAKHNSVLDVRINQCSKHEGTPWRDCIQIAQIFKYLSVDGLLENHPLPERCQGIDFRQAYKLVYQALMGYPIQPVNKATADFVLETVAELNGEIKKQRDAIKQVETFLHSKPSETPQNSAVLPKPTAPNHNDNQSAVKKPLKVYQRKKSASSNVEAKPCLKILVQEIPGSSESGCSKDFTVAVEGAGNNVSTVNVPVPYQTKVNENELKLLKSSSYNPFQIPEKWLKEPLYINLLQTP